MPKVDINAIVKDLNKYELKKTLKKVDFPRDSNVLNTNERMLIKMVNLVVDKDIYAKDIVVTLMSSLLHLSQVLN